MKPAEITERRFVWRAYPVSAAQTWTKSNSRYRKICGNTGLSDMWRPLPSRSAIACRRIENLDHIRVRSEFSFEDRLAFAVNGQFAEHHLFAAVPVDVGHRGVVACGGRFPAHVPHGIQSGVKRRRVGRILLEASYLRMKQGGESAPLRCAIMATGEGREVVNPKGSRTSITKGEATSARTRPVPPSSRVSTGSPSFQNSTNTSVRPSPSIS